MKPGKFTTKVQDDGDVRLELIGEFTNEQIRTIFNIDSEKSADVVINDRIEKAMFPDHDTMAKKKLDKKEDQEQLKERVHKGISKVKKQL